MKRTALLSLAALLGFQAMAPLVLAKDERAAKDERPSVDDEDGDNHSDISLSVGENYTLSAEGVKSYSEGVEGVVQVRLTPDGKQFVIVGKRPGSTSLLLLLNNGEQRLREIDVARFKMSKAVKELG